MTKKEFIKSTLAELEIQLTIEDFTAFTIITENTKHRTVKVCNKTGGRNSSKVLYGQYR